MKKEINPEIKASRPSKPGGLTMHERLYMGLKGSEAGNKTNYLKDY